MTAKQRLDLALDIYFSIAPVKRKLLSNMGYSHVLLEQIPLKDFKKLTGDKKVINDFKDLVASFE